MVQLLRARSQRTNAFASQPGWLDVLSGNFTNRMCDARDSHEKMFAHQTKNECIKIWWWIVVLHKANEYVRRVHAYYALGMAAAASTAYPIKTF